MSDRFFQLVVVLERDTRDDDAQPIIDAIKLIKGVAQVRGIVGTSEDYAAREQAKWELRAALWKALEPE
jgi:hypothetical protein